MAESAQNGHRARVRALLVGFAIGLALIPLIGWLVGNMGYGLVAGLMTGAALAAIFQDRVTRRRQRAGKEEPPSRS